MVIKRDGPGPDHRPEVRRDYSIDGVVTIESPFVKYSGDHVLTELYRPEWFGLFEEGEAIEHLYTVKAPSGGDERRVVLPRTHAGSIHAY